MDTTCRGARPPLYNMAAIGTGVKAVLEGDRPCGLVGGVSIPSTLRLDKLSFGGVIPQPPEAVLTVFEALGLPLMPSRMRFQGRRPLRKWWGWVFGVKGDEGVVVAELEALEGAGTSFLRLILNPQKLPDGVVGLMGRLLRAAGVVRPESLWVDRWDAAIDYSVHRGLLLLDYSRHQGDALGLCSYGPQTERVGYRKGSRLRVQLYDKTAERAARGQQEAAGWVTRFEVQRLEAGDSLRLVDLPVAPCPFPEDVRVRCLAFDPLTVADPVLAAVGALGRFSGMRFVRQFLRRFRPSQRADLLETILPEVDPAPSRVFAAGWSGEASRWVEAVSGGMRAGGFPAGQQGGPARVPA